MAEAHSATTLQYVRDVHEAEDTFADVLRAWKRSIKRKLCRTKNSLNNGMWPTSIYNLGFTVIFAYFLLVMDYEWARPITKLLWQFESFIYFSEDLPYFLRLFVLTLCFGVLFFVVLMFVRRYALRVLLSYRGWMNEPSNSQSISTILWAILVRTISGYKPSFYSYQASLPRMHVPPLRHTLKQLIRSLHPIYGADSDKIKRLTQQSKEFERTLGHKLQKILILKSWLYQNYVTDWWEKYVYLMNRSPLPINSNYYGLDHAYHRPTQIQSARAGMVMHLLAKFMKLMYREQMEPLLIRNTIPLCMAQYDRLFSTTRIPKVECDEIKHLDAMISRHIVVHRHGVYYMLNLMDRNGRIYPPSFLERQFEWIIDDADLCKDNSSNLPDLSCLTCWDRVSWANAREKHFSKSEPANQFNMDIIDSAIVYLSLEDEASLELTDRAKLGLYSKNMWADKSISFLVMSNGKISINAEHAWADAPVVGHLIEYIYTEEVKQPRQLYDEEGHCVDTMGCFVPRDKSEPQRLQWNKSADLIKDIEAARLFHQKNCDGVDLVVLDFRGFGKGFIKTCRVSPDAFIQIAIQLAYYRKHGKFAMTYESSMTRLYLCGRTETVRSLTQETADFVLSMVADKVDTGLRIRLLRRACDLHQNMYRDCMAGMGIDRHLFALFVISKGMGYESEFLHEVVVSSAKWTLSTSQQPQQQLTSSSPRVNCDLPEYRDCISPGGGFGPVSDGDESYGISYMVPGDFKLFFHISCKVSCTDQGQSGSSASALFGQYIFQALQDIKALFDTPGNP